MPLQIGTVVTTIFLFLLSLHDVLARLSSGPIDTFQACIANSSFVSTTVAWHKHAKSRTAPFLQTPRQAIAELVASSWSTKSTHSVNGFLLLFLCLFLFKYVRLVVNACAFWKLHSAVVTQVRTLKTLNVTVIIPTNMENETALVDCIRAIQNNNPARIIVVTNHSKVVDLELACVGSGLTIEAIGVPKLGKRLQLVAGIRYVETPITVFADDDVIWGKHHLHHLLDAMEDPQVGAAGSVMRCIRHSSPNLWNFLGIAYLERRNFNTGATNYLDGGISTLSGRTAMYRTKIIQEDRFYEGFLNDTWFGQVLNSDDDKFLTRWVYAHGWKIQLQFAKEATLFTSLESSASKFLAQCIRWARGHWRGNIRVMANESYWYQTHPWTCYSSYIGAFMTPSIVVDGVLFLSLNKGLKSLEVGDAAYYWTMATLSLWVLFGKIVKLLPHLYRYPQDARFVPASILFGYFHGFINIYALCTLHRTNWGTRADVDKPSVPTKESS